MAAELMMPCPFLVGYLLCGKPDGHQGRHEPSLPVITGRRMAVIMRQLLEPAWWRPAARCPVCRAKITGHWNGVMTGPAPDASGRMVIEYPVTFSPCGHQARRIIPAGEG